MKYEEYFAQAEKQWEDLCIRCGGCCGAFDDPCAHLGKDSQGRFFCHIYEHRFGTHTSLAGEKFDCVHIKEILNTPWKNDHLCAYKRMKKMPGLYIESESQRVPDASVGAGAESEKGT